MRDYRDAKAMAHTARAFLADHGLKITNSQSLELIAKTFGATDWNTLAAAIRAEASAPAPKRQRHSRRSMRGSGPECPVSPANLSAPYNALSLMLTRGGTSTRRASICCSR